jgi:DNA replication protein DnaC
MTDRGVALHAGVDARCRICKGRGLVLTPVGELSAAQACSCVGECPTCGGSGFVADTTDPRHAFGRARKIRCRCQEFLQRIARFNACGIPARHAFATRASFRPSADQRDAFMAVARWLTLFPKGQQARGGAEAARSGAGRGLVLYGPVGTGKTHLLCAMLAELVLEHGATARFIEFTHLLHDLKSEFGRPNGVSSLMDPLVEVDVLAIDELGKGRNTDFESSVVDELTSRRYNAMRAILGTTNHPPKPSTGRAAPNLANPDPTGEALVDRVGARVFSRLQEMCDFVEVPGQDYRVRLSLGDVDTPSVRGPRRT